MRQNAGLAWRFGAVVALVLATSTLSWPEDGAQDVLTSYEAQWDATSPLHQGRAGDFTYFSALFGGFKNAPPAE